MLKFVLVLCVAVALIMPRHETQAFKVINIQNGGAHSSAAAAPAFDPSPLIQGVQTAIAGKLQRVGALVGSLIQQKLALKQNALNSIQSTMGAVKSQVQTLGGGARLPFIIRKDIYIGAAPTPNHKPDGSETTTTHSGYATN